MPAVLHEPGAEGHAHRLRCGARPHRSGAQNDRGHRRGRADPRQDGRFFFPNQFANPANPRIHYETTAPELWDALDGRLDAFVYGSGTGGTVTGVGRFLKERLDDVLVVVVEPGRSAVLSGEERGQHKFQGMGPGFVPDNLDLTVVDRVVKAWEEESFPTARRAAREEGLFVGMSSGAILWAALELAKELGPGHRVACITPDSGARYLTTELFETGEDLDGSEGPG